MYKDEDSYRPSYNPEALKRAAVQIELNKPFPNPIPSWVADIVRRACTKHTIFPSRIFSVCKVRPVVTCRNEIMYLVRQDPLKPSLETIGKWFNRNHVSVMWGIASHSRDTGAPPLTPLDQVGRMKRNRLLAEASVKAKKIVTKPDWKSLTRDERLVEIKRIYRPGISAKEIASHFSGGSKPSICQFYSRNRSALADFKLQPPKGRVEGVGGCNSDKPDWRLMTREEKNEAIKRIHKPGIQAKEMADCFTHCTRNAIYHHYERNAEELKNHHFSRHKFAPKSSTMYVCPTGGRGPTRDELELLRELIPNDNRDYTSRMFGDPIPGDARRPWISEAIERYRAA